MNTQLNGYIQQIKPYYIKFGYLIYGAYGLYFIAMFLIALNPPADPSQVPAGVGSILSTLLDLIFAFIVPLSILSLLNEDRNVTTTHPNAKQGIIAAFIYPIFTGLTNLLILPLAIYSLLLVYIAISK